MNEYDPSDYDGPNELVFLLMFTNESDYMSPHFSPNNRSTFPPSIIAPIQNAMVQMKTITPILTMLGAPGPHL